MLRHPSFPVRLIIGLAFVGLAAIPGFFGRSPWLVPLLGLVFAVGYVGGKHPQWRSRFWRGGLRAVVGNMAGTYAVQTVLVSVLFVLGLGVGRLAGRDAALAPVTALDLQACVIALAFALATNALLARLPHPFDAAFGDLENAVSQLDAQLTDPLDDARPTGTGSSGGDLTLSSAPVTIETFFSGRHFSVADHMTEALTRWPTPDGGNVTRAPIAASEARLRAAEDRLGFRLPNTLRALYRRRDGGALPTYWVAAVDDPSGDYDDWIDAFANDYNDLRPLDQLERLIDLYEETFDPDYSDPDEKKDWLPGADKLVILAKRYGVATLLDYRAGDEAGVVLVDHEYPPGRQVRKSFASFDAFFAALRRQEDDRPNRRSPAAPRLAEDRSALDRPLRFWANGYANPTDAASDDLWTATGDRLGVPIPEAWRRFFAVLNGGPPALPYHQAASMTQGEGPPPVFPGGRLLSLQHWARLTDLSARIDFGEDTPYATLQDGAARLVVVAAHFDSALTLDFRSGASARVTYFHDLTTPGSGLDLGDPTSFLEGLRRLDPRRPDQAPIPDERLSPRRASVETFWAPENQALGCHNAALQDTAERLGVRAVPEPLAELMRHRDGGRVRFRYAPPARERQTSLGSPLNDPAAHEWIELFPGEIWPVKDWMRFTEFTQKHGLARSQNPLERLMPQLETQSEVEERLIVIGADGARALTLLDLSTSYFTRTPFLSRADYDAASDAFDLMIAPISITHVSHGALATVRGLAAEMGDD